MFFNLENCSTLLVCYFLGSIPFGLIITKVLNKHDPRLVGSKNIGATNILRTSGWKLGLLTLFCDVFKGYLPLIFFENSNLSIELMILFIFLGHLFPVWLRFKGGKGIAVIIGCLLAYNPIYGLAFATVWVSIAFISKYSSLSALTASLTILATMHFQKDSLSSIMIIIVAMIFLKHYSNIKRLLKGEEAKIILKK